MIIRFLLENTQPHRLARDRPRLVRKLLELLARKPSSYWVVREVLTLSLERVMVR